MDEVKNAENELFNKSSMSVVELNNYVSILRDFLALGNGMTNYPIGLHRTQSDYAGPYCTCESIVALRSTVKRAKNQTIHRLVKQIKQYRNKKGTEEQLTANVKKTDRLIAEMALLKKVKADKATKFSLGNTLTVQQAAGRGNLEEKVLTRIACCKLMQQKINRWRQEHEDWEALAAFALSKNTGRRFKNKPQSDLNTTLDINVPAENAAAVDRNNVSDKTAVRSFSSVQEDEILDSDSASFDDEVRNASSDKLRTSAYLLNTSDDNEPLAELRLQKQQPHDGSYRSVVRPDVVVKRISLDELGDELCLPPPDEEEDDRSIEPAMSSFATKITKDFFVVSSDEESVDGAKALMRAAASSDTDGDNEDDATSNNVLQSSIKSATMFAKSLSHHRPRNAARTTREDRRWKLSDRQNHRQKMKHSDNRNRGKQFSDKWFTKSRGSFPKMHGSRYHKKNDKSSRGNAKVNTNARGEQLGRKGSLTTTSVDADAITTHQKKPGSTVCEKLHPSWEASRQRKQRERNVFVFQGTRKTFSDDD